MSNSTTQHGFLRRTLVRVVRVLVVVIVLSGILAASAYSWLAQNILSTLPSDLSAYRSYRPPTACRVFAADGTKIDQFYVERRVWVPIDELDPWTWQAFIAAEDRRFLEHPGVDLQGIARALWINYTTGRDAQGASTITQQLVKNLIVGKERTYTRKLKEAILAWRLEQEMSKEELLELYINYVALGSGNYGVEAAAQDYFGVSARDIDAGQAALLAGLVPAPSRYSPRAEPETAARRREIVLGTMVAQKFLRADEIAPFLDDPVLVERGTRSTTRAAAYATQVRREVRRLLGEQLPFDIGLQVHTPLDLAVQTTAEAAVREALEKLQERQGRRGAIRLLEPEQWEPFLRRAPGLRIVAGEAEFPEVDACFEALVGPDGDLGDLRAASWHFALQTEDRALRVRDPRPESRPRTLAESVREGDILNVCLVSGAATDGGHEEGSGTRPQVRLDSRPWAEGAAVVLENRTGRIVALVGGYHAGLEGFIRATQARRQPGSSFKPYVYATALLGGQTQIDTVLDAPIALPGATGVWSPKNYTGDYAGPLPMRRALAKSLNTVAVRLILEAGATRVAETAKAMGVASPLRADPTLALGSSEVTPMDQALGYATIARMGVNVEPVYIDRVEDADERALANAGEPIRIKGETVALLPGSAGQQVLPPGVAYELADMLREVVQSGTARKARKPGFDRAGKTGTTNDFVDAWFVGFTPRHTIAVWVGTDGTTSLGDEETGGKSALPAWIRIAEALPEVEGERMPLPSEAILIPWEGQWVGLPRGAVPAHALPGPRLATDDAPLPDFP